MGRLAGFRYTTIPNHPEFAVFIDQLLGFLQLANVEPCRLPQGNFRFNDKYGLTASVANMHMNRRMVIAVEKE